MRRSFDNALSWDAADDLRGFAATGRDGNVPCLESGRNGMGWRKDCVLAQRLASLIVEIAENPRLARKIVGFGSGRAIHPITPLDLGLFTVRRAAG
jgi:hypothetical protein